MIIQPFHLESGASFSSRDSSLCVNSFSVFSSSWSIVLPLSLPNNSRFSSWTLFQRIYPTTNRAGQYGPEIKRAVNTCTISFPEAAILLVSDSIAPSPGQSNTDYLGTRWTCVNLVPRVFWLFGQCGNASPADQKARRLWVRDWTHAYLSHVCNAVLILLPHSHGKSEPHLVIRISSHWFQNSKICDRFGMLFKDRNARE